MSRCPVCDWPAPIGYVYASERLCVCCYQWVTNVLRRRGAA